jgi:hypothetical protein
MMDGLVWARRRRGSLATGEAEDRRRRLEIFLNTHCNSDVSQRTHTNPYKYMYVCKHLARLSWQIIKIDEITASASLSMETSPTAENASY